MDQWVRDTFPVVPNGWDDPGKAPSDAFSWTENGKFVNAPINWFATTFGAVTTPPTCAALKAVDPDDKLGWHKHFDAWATQGIIA